MSNVEDVVQSEKPKPDVDLSAKIILAVAKKSREQVTCRRITKTCYRCNWWVPQGVQDYDNPRMTGMMVTTSRISQSRFLRVIQGDDGQLQITVLNGENSQVR